MKGLIPYLLVICTSCMSFYEANHTFNRNYESGNMEEAEAALIANKRQLKRKSKFLYYANRGTVDYMMGDYVNSNRMLEKAYLFGEDYRRNMLDHSASYLSNPNIEEYPGEDHEHLMLLYYKALNYIKLNDYEAALIECRRMNQRLYELGDKYRQDRKFQRDAFIHMLMGLIYEANHDHNNAFIAYRNAHTIYKEDYVPLFGLETPHQLKQDILRTAYLSGFRDEVAWFEREFGLTYVHQPNAQGELIFLWHNGLAPIKDEIALQFNSTTSGGGVMLTNEEAGISLQYDDWAQPNKLEDFRLLRVTLPQYLEREPLFTQGYLVARDTRYSLELVENVNDIAFQTLKQRMGKEVTRSLVRAATKKGVETAASQENEWAGLMVSMLNAGTEKADTRNWQTLPYEIRYVRIPLEEGANKISLFVKNGSKTARQEFVFEGVPNQTIFHAYQTLN